MCQRVRRMRRVGYTDTGPPEPEASVKHLTFVLGSNGGSEILETSLLES
jgi:hypothetical protein